MSYDPEFTEYEKYLTETKQRIRDQFEALEDAGFIKYIPNDSTMPRIGRREPEPNTRDLIEHMGQLGINLKDLGNMSFDNTTILTDW